MTDRSLEPESVEQLLCSADCPDTFTRQFLELLATGSTEGLLRLLRTQRCRQLERLHAEEKNLDNLDLLRYKLEKQQDDN